jgi:predicted SnoaL-like aldol condensation-catalyzing enzyme
MRKQQAVDLLKAIETGAAEPLAVARPDYKQHNLAVPDGLAGLGAVILQLPEGSARVNTVRAFEDGDFVFTHTDYDFFGPKIGFDIFRFDEGKIVEHWDNLQQTAGPNASGRSMIDGPTAAADLHLTSDNKALAQGLVENILIHRRMERIGRYVEGDHYLQHNPLIGDGLAPLGKVLEAIAYDRIHIVLGEGNFVLVVSEGTLSGEPTSFYDLFRVENGKIVEHWDTIEAIPPPSDWKNQNGKFGF